MQVVPDIYFDGGQFIELVKSNKKFLKNWYGQITDIVYYKGSNIVLTSGTIDHKYLKGYKILNSDQIKGLLYEDTVQR